MNLFKTFFLLMLVVLPIGAATESLPFALISMPKSGTFLAERFFCLVQTRKFFWVYDIAPSDPTSPLFSQERFSKALDHRFNNGFSLVLHLNYIRPFLRYLDSHPELVIILQIRDLRDVLVSAIYHCWDKIEAKYGPSSFDQKLKKFLDGTLEMELDGHIFDFSSSVQAVLRLIHFPHVVVSRFEDLVGEKGGGELSKQLELIHQMASAIGIELDQKTQDNVLADLFGRSWTFRKGQIGSWKSHFSTEDLQRFNKQFGKLQLALGYPLD